MEQETLAGCCGSGCPLAWALSAWFFCVGRGNGATQALMAMSNAAPLMQWTAIYTTLHSWKFELNVLTYSRVTGTKCAPAPGTECFEGRRNILSCGSTPALQNCPMVRCLPRAKAPPRPWHTKIYSPSTFEPS